MNVMYQVHWDKPLGQGGFGDVYFATDQATGERVACKQISKEYTDDVAFRREMEAFLHLKEHGGHPNICTLRETFDEGSNYYLIFDLISGGEMFDHLINKYVCILILFLSPIVYRQQLCLHNASCF